MKRRLDTVAQGGFADERRSFVCGREHYRANPRCLLLASLVRRLLSARLAGSRRTLTFRTTRDFVVAVSPSVSRPGRSTLRACRRTHARGGGGNPHA